MVVTAALLAIGKTGAGKVIGLLTPEARRLMAQRRIVTGGGAATSDPLTAALDEVIAVLTGRAEKAGVLREWLAHVRQSIVGVEDPFRGDSLKAWLDDPDVRSALRVVTAGFLVSEQPAESESQANAVLAAAYERHLGDRKELAQGAIDLVARVLAAGVHAALSADPGAGALAVLIQAGHDVQGEKLDRIESTMRSVLVSGGVPRPSVLPRDGVAEGQALRPTPLDIAAVSRAFGTSSQMLLGWPQEINGCWMERPELESLYALAVSDTAKATVLLGGPGSGKSALLARLGVHLANEGVLLLAIKADQVPRQVSTLEALDRWIGVDTSTATALRELSATRQVVLLVDQLDALADLMDVHGERMTVLLRLVHEVAGIPNIQVILTCRDFEFRYDVRLKSLRAESVELALPSWQQVSPLLTARGLDPSGWSEEVQDVLRTPQHLALFLTYLAGSGNTPTFATYQALLEEVVASRIERRFGPRTLEAAEQIAIAMAEDEELRIGRARFDRDFRVEVSNLEAEGFLLVSTDRLSLAFRHQTLFDFIRTRAFLREGTSVAAYVIDEKQESLFVRPILWSTLQYLRASDRASFRREFGALWSREALRPHLRSLLVAFLGQVNNPDDVEARWLLPTLDAPNDRTRTLRAMSRGQGWLSRLQGRLPGLMLAPPQEAWPVTPLLRNAMSVERDTVLSLVERYWLPSSEYVGHALEVVQGAQEWDQRLGALAARLVTDLTLMTVQCRHLATTIARTRPNLAVQVVISRLQAELTRAKAIAASDSAGPGRRAVRNLLATSHNWHDLAKIVVRAPGQFVKTAWPWLLEALEASAPDANGQLEDGYRPAQVEAWVRSKGELHADIPAAFESAMQAFAGTEPDAFVAFAQARQASDLMAVHRLIAAGMERVATMRPQAALAYLLGDQRRFALGDYHDAVADTGRVIKLLVPALDADEALHLERAIITWPGLRVLVPDNSPELRRHRRARVRKLKLRLLRHFCADRLSQAGRRYRDQEERAYPGSPDFDIGQPVAHWVGSPMSAAQMATAGDDAILDLFKLLTDDTGWDHPKQRLMNGSGGSIQASREFATFAKEHPARALGLIERFQPGYQERPVGDALAELGKAEDIDAGEVVACVHRLEAAGFASANYRSNAAGCLREVARRADGLNDATCTVLEGWLEDWTAPEATSDGADGALRTAPEKEREPTASILWNQGGVEFLPGGNYAILDAITLGRLLRGPPDVEGWLGVLERHLARPENPQVWLSLVRFLDYLRLADVERAATWLRALFQRVPELLHSKAGVRMIFHVRGIMPPDLYAGVRQSWLTSGWADGPQAVGEITALHFCHHVGDPGALADLTELIEGLSISPEQVPGVRLGATYTLVEAWREPILRAHVTPLLVRLMSEADAETADALQSVFLLVDPFPVDGWSDQLLRAFVAHPRVLGKRGGMFVLDRLKDVIAGGGDAKLVYDVVSALMDEAVSQLEDIRTNWSGQVGELAEIALTLHRMPETRVEGLLLFERLIASEAYGMEEQIVNLDRRSLI